MRLSNCRSVWGVLALSCAVALAEDEGFESLIGSDLSNWEAVGGPLESWKIDGELLITSGEGGGWLSTTREYADFEFQVEYKLPPDGNSGIFIRAPHEGHAWIDGMEIQLLDETAEIHQNLQPYQYTGSVYGVVPAQRGASGKPGEWQSIAIRCEGSHITVTLNGTVVVDDDLRAHPEAVAEHPGIQRPAGYVGLQNHGTPVEFRNVRIREL